MNISLHINNTSIQAPPGSTVLEAARRAGIDIPTLCHRDGMPPLTSCFLCAIRVEGHDALQPACALTVADGMAVTTDSEEILQARRTALELLLSDHAGRCEAPCAVGCPAHLDIPAFLAPLARGDWKEAVREVRRHLALPAILGRVCRAFCEGPCLRKNVDEPLSIRLLHRFVADTDMASGDPTIPAKFPSTGKRVAVIGAGPAGLTAAWFLLLAGHDVTIFEASSEAGGLLRKIPADVLDAKTIDAEVAVIRKGGAEFRFNWKLGRDGSLRQLRAEFNAVLLATGGAWVDSIEQRKGNSSFIESLGLEPGTQEKFSQAQSFEPSPVTHPVGAISLPDVFVAGEVTTGASNVVRAGAAGRAAAISIGQFLSGEPVAGPQKPYYFVRKITPEEHERLYGGIVKQPRVVAQIGGGLSQEQALAESARCMQCSCLKRDDCRLREYGAGFGANQNRFSGDHRTTEVDNSHPLIVFDPGKCVLCGLCVEITKEASEAHGLAFAGRGFPTRIVTPLGGDLLKGLSEEKARECAEACPTGAITLKNEAT